jgi:DNA-directed RNA polymerase sigma subunit (sigma70/sigma32)
MNRGTRDGIGMTYKQAAARLGITPERVRQIEKGALLKLRRALEALETPMRPKEVR